MSNYAENLIGKKGLSQKEVKLALIQFKRKKEEKKERVLQKKKEEIEAKKERKAKFKKWTAKLDNQIKEVRTAITKGQVEDNYELLEKLERTLDIRTYSGRIIKKPKWKTSGMKKRVETVKQLGQDARSIFEILGDGIYIVANFKQIKPSVQPRKGGWGPGPRYQKALKRKVEEIVKSGKKVYKLSPYTGGGEDANFYFTGKPKGLGAGSETSEFGGNVEVIKIPPKSGDRLLIALGND